MRNGTHRRGREGRSSSQVGTPPISSQPDCQIVMPKGCISMHPLRGPAPPPSWLAAWPGPCRPPPPRPPPPRWGRGATGKLGRGRGCTCRQSSADVMHANQDTRAVGALRPVRTHLSARPARVSGGGALAAPAGFSGVLVLPAAAALAAPSAAAAPAPAAPTVTFCRFCPVPSAPRGVRPAGRGGMACGWRGEVVWAGPGWLGSGDCKQIEQGRAGSNSWQRRRLHEQGRRAGQSAEIAWDHGVGLLGTLPGSPPTQCRLAARRCRRSSGRSSAPDMLRYRFACTGLHVQVAPPPPPVGNHVHQPSHAVGS